MHSSLTRPLRYRRRTFLAALVRRLGGALRWARWCYHLQVEGETNLPAQGAVILVCNHVSLVSDGLAYLVIQRCRPQVYLFDMYLVKNEFTGMFGALGVPDFGPQQLLVSKRPALSAQGLLHAHQILLQQGAVAIFPEGELSWDGRLQYPLERGAAWLGLHTAAPIVPVVSHGGYDIQPSWDLEKLRLTGRICIRIGQPFHLCAAPLTDIPDQALQEANERLWQAMASLAGRPGGFN